MDENRRRPATIDDYIAQFPEDVQQALGRVRAAIHAAAPEAVEKISYQMPAFYLRGVLVWFRANRREIGFYPTPSGIDAFRAETSAYRATKGALHFPLDRPMPEELIRKIVRHRLIENLSQL